MSRNNRAGTGTCSKRAGVTFGAVRTSIDESVAASVFPRRREQVRDNKMDNLAFRAGVQAVAMAGDLPAKR
jgi:hypothetical protein